MAKNNGNAESLSTEDDVLKGATLVAPTNAKRVKTSTDGFWDEESKYPLHCRVLFGREVVPSTGPSKGKKRPYAVVELVAPTMLKERKGDNPQPARAAKAGEVIAVWLPPGLEDLTNLAGSEVWVKRNPKEEWKNTGKGNAMKTYDIRFISGSRKRMQFIPFSSLDDGGIAEKPPVSDDEIPF